MQLVDKINIYKKKIEKNQLASRLLNRTQIRSLGRLSKWREFESALCMRQLIN